MKVLIACEFSGIVRDAFAALGHDAWSCDLLPTERPGNNYQCDIFDVLYDNWDLIIAHPPCTDLCVSGARWFEKKRANGFQQKSIDFFMEFTKLKCKWAIENPIGIMSTIYRKPDQIIEPYHFGHPETKKTCLWLNGLEKLIPTDIVEPKYIICKGKKYSPTHYNSYSSNEEERSKNRSRTYQGIADAMAQQWGNE